MIGDITASRIIELIEELIDLAIQDSRDSPGDSQAGMGTWRRREEVKTELKRQLLDD